MNHALQLRTATPSDHDWIHELRHRVYAQELGQHPVHPAGCSGWGPWTGRCLARRSSHSS
ncbi:hypothetical protein ACFVTY_39490 [Streptomyces sp. NPDC058067]|uniref:hypothetical protein n=1 Tax=Streptomyces sp. NPDC058067 TaxID=3346324 RepID=UPI0036DFCEDE